LSQPPIALNKARPGLDFGPRVESVMMRGLSREPVDRYPDVLMFARELREALLEPPGTSASSAPPPSTSASGSDSGSLFSKMKGLFGRG
jgi:eukaryotic-like serine/threonine-protein kinase